MSTAAVELTSSKFEVRNALSRAYYAVFHASRAWLLTRGVPLKKSQRHRELQKLIAKNRGANFATRLTRLYTLREQSDYWPEMLAAIPYAGDLGKLRVIAEVNVRQARDEFEWYLAETNAAPAGFND